MTSFEGDDDKPFFAAHDESLIQSLKIGFFTGTTCILVGYPLDTIKVRLQSGKYKLGSVSGMRGIFSGLYRGVTSPLAAVVPSWAVTFWFYGIGLKMLGDDSLVSVACAGGLSGFGYSFIICPFECAKVNTQVQQSQSLFQVTRSFMQNHGFFSLYRGYGACFCRDIGQTAAYYFLAEYLNRKLAKVSWLGPDWAPFAAGALTGVGHCTVEYPFDCIKTMRQVVDRKEVFPLGGTGEKVPLPTGPSYKEILKRIRTDSALQKNLGGGYLVWLSRAVIAHSASFGLLQQCRNWLPGCWDDR